MQAQAQMHWTTNLPSVDTPAMKTEHLLQIQGNMLTRFLSPMKIFGKKPKKARPLLEPRDHPENDLSEFCDQDQIKQYQTIVGRLIWLTGPLLQDISNSTGRMANPTLQTS